VASETTTIKTNMADAWVMYETHGGLREHKNNSEIRALMFQLQNAIPYLKARRVKHPEAYVEALESRDRLLGMAQRACATDNDTERQLMKAAADQLRNVPV